jgi:hypothetical protein
MTIMLACSGTASWWLFGLRLGSGMSRRTAGHDHPASLREHSSFLMSRSCLIVFFV